MENALSHLPESLESVKNRFDFDHICYSEKAESCDLQPNKSKVLVSNARIPRNESCIPLTLFPII